jgi:hypothetical protein
MLEKPKKGRPKGSKSKDDPKAFVAAIERALAASGPTENLVNLTCRQIKAGNTPVMLRILDMKFGKPAQTTQLTGADGDALKIIIEHITA